MKIVGERANPKNVFYSLIGTGFLVSIGLIAGIAVRVNSGYWEWWFWGCVVIVTITVIATAVILCFPKLIIEANDDFIYITCKNLRIPFGDVQNIEWKKHTEYLEIITKNGRKHEIWMGIIPECERVAEQIIEQFKRYDVTPHIFDSSQKLSRLKG